ncbi:hypothetical protein [Poseidonibacter ostreae]|nr:hypothetical protein [Poseidonibacter ostreae]
MSELSILIYILIFLLVTGTYFKYKEFKLIRKEKARVALKKKTKK